MTEMIKLGTKCNDCIFFHEDKCKIYVLESFADAGAAIHRQDGNTVIDRVCPYKRGVEWSSEKEPYLNADTLDKLMYETYVSGTIIIICKDGIEKLNDLLSKVDNIENIDKFKKIIVHLENTSRADILSVIEDKKDYTVMQIFSESISGDSINLRSVADEAFKRAKNGYLFFIDIDQEFDENAIDKINSVINVVMKRLLYVRPIDGKIHQMVCMAPLYKLLKGNKLQEIECKIKEIAESAKCDDGIMSWEEVNNDYK